MKIPHHWLTDGVNPEDLNEQVVANADRWDHQDWKRIRGEMAEVQAATDELGEFVGTGRPFMADAFWGLCKVRPERSVPDELKPSFLVNLAVWDAANDLPAWQQLRRYCRGDEVQSALSTVELEPTFEQLFDRERARQRDAEEFEERLRTLHDAVAEQRDLDEMIESLRDQPDAEERLAALEAQRADLDALIGRLQDQAGELADALGAALEGDVAEMSALLHAGLEDALNGARDLAAAADMWGVDPGALRMLNVDERLELASKIASDRIKRIMELFGPMRDLVWAVRKRRVRRSTDSVHRVTVGRDLHRALPSELAKLNDPLRQMEFFRDYAEGKILQYEIEGRENVGRGGMVVLKDISGSMHGDPEMWATAVDMNLLHVARKQNRSFYGIHFGSRREIIEFAFERPEDYTVEKTMAFAGAYFGGGTDFMAPLDMAMAKLEAQYKAHGQVDGDIVMLTDGQCGVTDQWLEEFQAKKKKMQVAVWGIFVGPWWQPEPLSTICDGHVCLVKDFVTGGDVREVFAGV